MTVFIVVVSFMAAAYLLWKGVVREIHRDGYGYRPPPRSHHDEQQRPGRLAPTGG